MTENSQMHVYAITTDAPKSHTSFQFELTRQMLSHLLGWRIDGKGIEEIESLLHEGVGVEVFTRHPHQKTGGTTYRFLPFIGELADDEVPSVPVAGVRRLDDNRYVAEVD